MKQTLLSFFVLASCSLLWCCKKNSGLTYDFTQYTATDANGNSTGLTDTTDWTYDATWSSGELALLAFKDTLTAGDSTAGTIALSPPFPNPGSTFFMGINPEKACKMKLVVVDHDFHILHYRVSLFTGGPILTVYDLGSLTAFHSGSYYRMYYGFYTSKDSLYYKGHGDLLFQ